jgi:hypothetical protein
MRTNSIIGEPMQFTTTTPKVPEVKETDWEKVANSDKFTEVMTYLEGRKEYYRRFLPDGRPVEEATPEERVAHWNLAVCVIKEIEGFQANLILSKK